MLKEVCFGVLCSQRSYWARGGSAEFLPPAIQTLLHSNELPSEEPAKRAPLSHSAPGGGPGLASEQTALFQTPGHGLHGPAGMLSGTFVSAVAATSGVSQLTVTGWILKFAECNFTEQCSLDCGDQEGGSDPWKGAKEVNAPRNHTGRC